MDQLIKELPDLFDNYSVHPAGVIIITQGSERCLVFNRFAGTGSTPRASYSREGEQDFYRIMAGTIEEVKEDLINWRNRVS